MTRLRSGNTTDIKVSSLTGDVRIAIAEIDTPRSACIADTGRRRPVRVGNSIRK